MIAATDRQGEYNHSGSRRLTKYSITKKKSTVFSRKHSAKCFNCVLFFVYKSNTNLGRWCRRDQVVSRWNPAHIQVKTHNSGYLCQYTINDRYLWNKQTNKNISFSVLWTLRFQLKWSTLHDGFQRWNVSNQQTGVPVEFTGQMHVNHQWYCIIG